MADDGRSPTARRARAAAPAKVGHGGAAARPPRAAPEAVAPTTRVNVAMPFSRLTVEQPGREFTELVAIVADLCAALEEVAPGPRVTELRKRARRLVLQAQ